MAPSIIEMRDNVQVHPILKSECRLIDGIELPLPRGRNYTTAEIADFMLDYGRSFVMDATADAGCYQKRNTLHRLFPRSQPIIDHDKAHSILEYYPIGSSEWYDHARVISNTNGGPSLDAILDKFKPIIQASIGRTVLLLEEITSMDSNYFAPAISRNIDPNRVSLETCLIIHLLLQF